MIDKTVFLCLMYLIIGMIICYFYMIYNDHLKIKREQKLLSDYDLRVIQQILRRYRHSLMLKDDSRVEILVIENIDEKLESLKWWGKKMFKKVDVLNYQALAMRTDDGLSNERLWNIVGGYPWLELNPDKINPGDLLNGVLGLTGEAGEVADMVKKHIFHGHELDREGLIKELGDVAWYIAFLCKTLGVSLEEVLARNIEKLEARYPDGFSSEASINREE